MVGTRWMERIPARAITVLGALCAITCISISAWLFLVRGEQVDELVRELRVAVRRSHERVATLRRQTEHEQVTLEALQQERSLGGGLPREAPVEAYFGALSDAATGLGLRVLRHQPLSGRSYEGLRESRFVFDVAGATADLLRLLRWVENAPFWADVGYLSVEGGSSRHEPGTERTAQLVISLFSATGHESTSADSEETTESG